MQHTSMFVGMHRAIHSTLLRCLYFLPFRPFISNSRFLSIFFSVKLINNQLRLSLLLVLHCKIHLNNEIKTITIWQNYSHHCCHRVLIVCHILEYIDIWENNDRRKVTATEDTNTMKYPMFPKRYIFISFFHMQRICGS